MTNGIKFSFAALVLGISLLATAAPAQANHNRSCCPPPPPREVVLLVCHPCTGCKHEVPVCVPACCDGAPSVCFERTLIGAGRSVYEWPCGHRVVVRYNNHGGYRVAQR